jgi:glycosyltransferase involved in cell wall biosynthesis
MQVSGGIRLEPKVTFVIPCYKLAHLLAECVNSILSQTYQDFEVLIMDDCSPDNTPEVARTFKDPRVKHIRNEPNLGHLRNYNKGISLAHGKYVWIISADDRLRQPYILQRYVELMDSHPKVGYVFCAGIGLEDGRETKVLDGYSYGNRDKIFEGRRFVSRILTGDGILAAAVMVRKECYLNVSLFPLDMPHRADIYLWCLFALHYDVAYLAEPMVNYRLHAASMMSTFTRESPWVMVADSFNVLWSIERNAKKLGLSHLIGDCQEIIGRLYACCILANAYERRADLVPMSLEECERSVAEMTENPHEQQIVRSYIYISLADQHRLHDERARALQSYASGLRLNPFLPRVWIKYLLTMGGLDSLFNARLTPVSAGTADDRSGSHPVLESPESRDCHTGSSDDRARRADAETLQIKSRD